MKIGSGSTRTDGYFADSSSQEFQCVTARRPSSNPAAASRKAPVHTDVTRRARPAASRTQSTYTGSALAGRTPPPPTTTNVSIGSSAAAANVRCGTTANPSDAVTGSGVSATTSV